MQAAQQGIFSSTTPSGRRVYAIGDIHGRLDLLEALLEAIAVDAASGPSAENVIVCLGDYVDRGPNSRGVVERLSQSPPRGFEIVCLKGNHEDMMLKFLMGEGEPGDWLKNGGRETLKSYGVPIADLYTRPLDEDAVEAAREALRLGIPGSHVAFLTTLDLLYEEGDYLFVHAGVKPAVALSEQREEDLIWIRNEFLNCDEDFGKIIVHGHSIHLTPKVTANRISIDTGAWRSDVLTALVLEGSTRRFLST